MNKESEASVGHNYCWQCGNTSSLPGRGTIHDPSQPWWKFWRRVECPGCGGDGYAKPPGWPDHAEIERLRPRMFNA